MREIVHLQAGQCGNQIGAKVRRAGEGVATGGSQRGVFGSPKTHLGIMHPRVVGEGRQSRARPGTKRPVMGAGPGLVSLGHSWPHSWATVTLSCLAQRGTAPPPRAADGMGWHRVALMGPSLSLPPLLLLLAGSCLAVALGSPVTSQEDSQQLEKWLEGCSRHSLSQSFPTVIVTLSEHLRGGGRSPKTVSHTQ